MSSVPDPEMVTEAGDKTASLQERAHALLRTMIQDGRIAGGQILQEAQVAKAFGISRSPARHALRSLHLEGLIDESGGKGYVVAGRVEGRADSRMATLDPIKIQATPQWERIYKEVEQELFVRVLFGPIRINEKQLSLHFDVSRTVTRDLLARMHGMGLIVKDQTGHWLARQITSGHIRDLYEMRRLLEPQALLKSLPFVGDVQLRNARDNITRALDSPAPDSAAFDQVERDLHIGIQSFCPNKEILRALERTHLVFGPTRYLFHPFLGVPVEIIDAALREHLDIIDRLLRQDGAGAAQALYDHLMVADDRWLRRFEIIARTTQMRFPPYLSPAGA
ncbi:GntR family transcriptional regulator [Skermanella stibiiresistens SB22]|uniref:GntR family transcriptional regulator n=1 Tax=Skermanella stibiiresistens SB22 TaxID=1385369 RepID=W9H6Q6_9PROT|nr:GntR family transcriptional regulator [Skermanella stibiiresistens]EWY41704.1 GntR family transcriptional regulator [Skermanella stibiiresistens SB22]